MKSYRLGGTKHQNLFRVLDLDGDWEHYIFVREFAENYDPTKPIEWAHLKDFVCLRGSTTILGKGYAKGAFLESWLSNHTADERDEIMRNASDRGDMVHRFIDLALTSGFEDLDKGGSLNQHFDRTLEIHNRYTGEERRLTNDEWGMVLAWAHFMRVHEPIILSSELPVYSLTEGYAGTGDAIMILTKECGVKACSCRGLEGKIGLYDWKTSKGIYPSYTAQNSSYAHADNLHEYLPPQKVIDYTAVLRLGAKTKSTGGCELEVSEGEVMEQDMARFRAAKTIADYGYKPFDPASDVVEIPDDIQLLVQRFNFEEARKPKAPPKVKKARKLKAKVK